VWHDVISAVPGVASYLPLFPAVSAAPCSHVTTAFLQQHRKTGHTHNKDTALPLSTNDSALLGQVSRAVDARDTQLLAQVAWVVRSGKWKLKLRGKDDWQN
jgi:hypothetical protein